MSKDFEAKLSVIVSTRLKGEEAAKARAAERAKIQEQCDNEWNQVRDRIVEPVLNKALEALKQGNIRASVNKPSVRRLVDGGYGETRVVSGTSGIELEITGGADRTEELVLKFEPSGWGRVVVKHHLKSDERLLSDVTEEYVEQRTLAFLNVAVLNQKI